MGKSKAFDHSKYKDWISPDEVIPYQMNTKMAGFTETHTPNGKGAIDL